MGASCPPQGDGRVDTNAAELELQAGASTHELFCGDGSCASAFEVAPSLENLHRESWRGLLGEPAASSEEGGNEQVIAVLKREYLRWCAKSFIIMTVLGPF